MLTVSVIGAIRAPDNDEDTLPKSMRQSIAVSPAANIQCIEAETDAVMITHGLFCRTLYP